jgi:hypothetical protein
MGKGDKKNRNRVKENVNPVKNNNNKKGFFGLPELLFRSYNSSFHT